MKTFCYLLPNPEFANRSLIRLCEFTALKPLLHEPSRNGYNIDTKTELFCYTTITHMCLYFTLLYLLI